MLTVKELRPYGQTQNKPVLVAYLSGDMVHADFAQSLGMMLMYSIARPGIWLGVNNTRCSVIDHGRNVAAQQVYASDASHILFLDSDMSFPAETLHRFLSHGVDIVGATYCTRRPPRAMTHLLLDASSRMPEWTVEQPLIEVHSLGAGCLLISRRVLDALGEPKFQALWKSPKLPHGEDRIFCARAREAGFKVWCDFELSMHVRHWGMYGFSPDDIETEVEGSTDELV